METLINKIQRFLSVGYGSVSGYGDGYGYGFGDGFGDGYGYGYGFGDGSGNGYGFGDGFGYGFGDGFGDGYGYGSGYGDGYGYGYGYGFGDGYGYGSGYGFGSGLDSGNGYGSGNGYDDVKQLNGYEVYVINDIQTIITSVRSDIAEGFILNADLTLSPCFICKGENLFAHGKTLHEAYTSLQEKLLDIKPIEGKIKLF